MRTGNPALGEKTFQAFTTDVAVPRSSTMTLEGTATKTGFLLLVVTAAASITWSMVGRPESAAAVAPLAIGGAIGGLIVAIVLYFKQTWARYLATLYAALEGLFLGAISAVFEAMYPGIVVQAVGLTIGVAFALLLAYRARIIRATENFKLGVFAATGGIFMLYMATFLLRLFGMDIGFVHSSGPWGIAFSAFVVVIAALNLVLDFDFIEKGVEHGAPKHMEWYSAFGLLVTLVWLYVEILRLLAKLRSR